MTADAKAAERWSVPVPVQSACSLGEPPVRALPTAGPATSQASAQTARRLTVLTVEKGTSTMRWIASIAAQSYPDSIICEARTAQQVGRMIRHAPVDLVLIDVQGPDPHGIEVIQIVKRLRPAAACVVVADLEDDAHIFASLTAGAMGYLLKDQPLPVLVEHLTRAAEGVPALAPAVARRMIQRFAMAPPSAPLEDSELLSRREKIVLRLIAQGRHIHQVAEELHISAHTVCSHIKSIYRKLHVSTRAEVALAARRLGLV